MKNTSVRNGLSEREEGKKIIQWAIAWSWVSYELNESVKRKNFAFINRFGFSFCICSICGKTSNTKFHAEEHARTHTGEKVKCEFCDKEYSNKANRYAHVKKEHSEKIKPKIKGKIVEEVQTTISCQRGVYHCTRCGKHYSGYQAFKAYDHPRECPRK